MSEKINDLQLDGGGWRNYPDLMTESLWLIERHGEEGLHSNDYHGLFLPAIPNQLLRRYTCPGDWVADPFLGMGTTLIEAARLGRNGFGIELNQQVASTARLLALAAQAQSEWKTSQVIANGDCRNPALWERINQDPDLPDEIDFLLMHPPYWDIVKFSDDDPADLSQAKDFGSYFGMLEAAFLNVLPWLKAGRYGALVIGDLYKDGEWITLGHLAWELLAQRGMKLKGKIVKNVGHTRGKGKDTNLWHYRSLKGGFFRFAYEEIYVFQKPHESRVWKLDPAWVRPGAQNP